MSWAKLAEERRRAVAEALRTPPAHPAEKPPGLQPEPGSGGAGATLGTPRQMSNMPNVPNTLCRQGSSHEEVADDSPFATVGMFGSRHEAESGVDQLIPGVMPDPLDLAERAAILEADGLHREAAETQALQEAGLLSWETYAAALAAHLRSRVEAVAGFSPADRLERYWQVLGRHSLSFLGSRWWPLTCRCGWALTEVFGVHRDAPLVRMDAWGLAVAPALSSLPPTRLIELTCGGATFATKSGCRLSWPRFSAQQPEQAIPWWELAINTGSPKS